MLKSPKQAFLVLLSVVLVALCSGLALRGMIIQDSRNHFEKEHLDGIDLKYQSAGKYDAFIERSGNLAFAWTFVLTGLVFVLGVLFARKQAGPVATPLQSVPSEERTKSNEVISIQDKNGHRIKKGIPEPEQEVLLQGISVSNTDVAGGEVHTEAMLDEPLDSEEQDVQPFANDPDRIKKIIVGLDELAKAEARGRALQKQPLEIAQHLIGIIDKVRGLSEEKNVLFNLECENGITLSADLDCLTGIMTNLVDNAAKAVKNGGVVTVSAAARGEYVEFGVRDTGTGIRRKDLPHLFERFYRASGSGIGLGLTIVKKLVDACGGRIEVQSTWGKGSVVTVRIPMS